VIADRIRQARRAQPFEPFDPVLADGRRFTITHPDYVSLPPGAVPRDVVFYTPRENVPGDLQTHWVNLGLVAEPVVPTGTATAGQPPRDDRA
jgi:hypothetical protein